MQYIPFETVWKTDLQERCKMSMEDDILYLKILVFSFLSSFVVKRFRHREYWNGQIGLFLVLIVCRTHVLYSFGCVVLNLLLIQLCPKRNLHHASFVVSFGYLAFCRCAHFVGLPRPYPHANAVQLIMTLRCIGLAFEIHDAKKLQKGGDCKEMKNSVSLVVPDLLECFLYLYNFVGLFTGPYYSYKVHSDMVESKWLKQIPVAHEIAPRLMITPFYIGICLFVDKFFPLQYAHTDEFYENLGLLTRFLYMVPVFIYLRMRVYVAWTLAESACIANGLGAYPAVSKPRAGRGPTDLSELNKRLSVYDACGDVATDEFSFETIKNVDPYECEFSPGFRSGMRAWNKSVQYWLATYIYKRSPKAIRMPVTMLVSAFWHGIHPGYYLSFLTVPLCTLAEDQAFSIFRKRRDSELATSTFDLVWWFLRMRGFEYMAMGFLLLSWESTVRYWASIHYFLHVYLLFVIVATYAYKYAMQIFDKRREGVKEE